MAQRSPFPGMDPWLERHWGDLHHRVLQYACDHIAESLPEGLFASVEETVHVFDAGESIGRVRPDVAVFDRSDKLGNAATGGALAVASPVRLRLPRQPLVEAHIEIRAIEGGEPLVTAIEVISPTNKSDPRARKAYEKKREAYYDAGANVVEIDLLRDGEALIDVPWNALPDDQLTPYRACIRRAPLAEADMEVEYYPLPLRERLPRLAIPLRAMRDTDVVLDLQACIDQAYEKGRYAIRIDYAKPPAPPLAADDAAWTRNLVASQAES